MKKKIAVYVPSHDKDDNPIGKKHRATMLKYAKMQFAHSFGGYTVFEAVGGWMNDKNKLIEEQVTIVSSFYDMDDIAARIIAEKVAMKLYVEMYQDLVSIEQNGELIFFKGEKNRA